MEKIQKSDLRQIDYQEFGTILDNLTAKIIDFEHNTKIKFDLLVPILRSGAFTGMHLASKLGIINILPAQYKYVHELNGEKPVEQIVKKFELPELTYALPDELNILITDSNTVGAGIARKVIADIHNKFPTAKLYFASANLDYSLKFLQNVEQIFYGAYSNEARLLSKEEAQKLGVTNDVIIFPWEELEEQWADINSSS